jgi:hypothetical protein
MKIPNLEDPGGFEGSSGRPGAPGLPGGSPNTNSEVFSSLLSETSFLDGIAKAGKVCGPVLEMKIPLGDKLNWLSFLLLHVLLLKVAEQGHMECAKILVKELGVDGSKFH